MKFEEKILYVFDGNDITIIELKGEKEKIKYFCNCCNKEYEYKCARNLFSKISLCKDCYNPFSRWNKERIQDRLNKLFPESQIEVIEFLSLRKGGKVKCLKCGTIEDVKNFDALFCARKDYFCNNCEKELNKIYKHMEEELNLGYLTLLSWNGVNNKSKFQCNRCGHMFEKIVNRKFSGKICPNCSKVCNKFSFEEGQELLNRKGNNEYTLLQYAGTNKRSLIRHKCGFIYSTRLLNFENTKGCPKCYKKISKEILSNQ